jgi:tRNA(His) 5'-end guanylyltransferase
MTDQSLLKRGIGELQRSLERFETYNDGFILPDSYLVLRLDAHRYGDWSSVASGEYPCGERLTEVFHRTTASLMASSFRIVLAFCHGDEISLFLDPVENNNPLRRSRIISLLSSAAAIHFAEASGLSATFEARLGELPSQNRVIEYFLWQRRYCFRNAITIALRTALKARGCSDEEIEKSIQGVPEEDILGQLTSLGTPVERIPRSTRRGALFWWEEDGRDGRSQFRLRTLSDVPDSDQEFLDLVSRLIRGKSITVDTPGPANAKPHARSTSPQPGRVSRKSNTSVFKL